MSLIAVDAMGGDTAPREIVEGAILAAESGIDIVLVGDEEQIAPLLEGRGVSIIVRHAGQIIDMHDDPTHAIRDKKDASIVVAARMVADGEADALVSAGSTGAAMACAAFIIGRLKGVARPAIGSIFPTGHVIMDVGANLECKPEHLLQFAVMGSALAQVYRDVEKPRVGLLNIGEERSKGRTLEKESYELLAASKAIDFIGNVEGRDLAAGTADVIVTDGFTGNVFLKTSEGAGKVIQRMVFEMLAKPEYQSAVAELMPVFMELRERLSSETIGGAHLVGTKGVVVIAHGSSSRVAMSNAIEIAAAGVDQGLVDVISVGISAAMR
ncbi:Phosphate:acyl-ACP acyltransferase PlsX (EC 2.3.1.n2) [hydrothermal vent metagenome]|uniref:phosphate acyltransferase n=1 Tax=hydrothermal vent metagenome TaxID=652676 RepID=A0A3B0T0C4_9ZZZZ